MADPRQALLEMEATLRRVVSSEVAADFPESRLLFLSYQNRKAGWESQERDEHGRWTAGGASGPLEVNPDVHEKVQKLLGRDLTDHQIAALVGAPNEAKIKLVTWDDPMHGPGVAIVAEHPDIEDQAVAMIYNGTGKYGDPVGPFLHYEQIYFKPEARGSGKGVQMMARAVEAAHQAGLPTVDLTGVGSKEFHPEENGYYTWARIGFDAPVGFRPTWPAQFRGAGTLSNLMKMPGGAAFWKEHGGPTGMTMDTTPNSQGRQVMDAYLKARGLKA